MIFSLVGEMLQFPFLVRAFLVGSLLSLCAALLGVSLVLKRYALIGDGLSHVGFATMAIASTFSFAPLAVSIPVVVLAAFFLLRISENSKIKGDSAIALISSSALAVGIIVVSFSKGITTDVCNFMFGSILAISLTDTILSIIITLAVLVMYVLFYNHIFALTFDETFAKAIGIKTSLFNMILALITAVMIVLGMRMMGALLISSLIIFPSLTSMRLFKTFKSVVISSAIISVVCFLVGMLLSYILETPTGATIVCLNGIMFVCFHCIAHILVRMQV